MGVATIGYGRGGYHGDGRLLAITTKDLATQQLERVISSVEVGWIQSDLECGFSGVGILVAE